MAKTLPPALQIRIARRCNIEDWIEPALLRLLRTPLRKLTSRDIAWLGLETYIFLGRAREQHDILRRTIGLIPPQIDSAPLTQCAQHGDCVKTWNHVWVFSIGKRLLHPDPYFALAFWELEDAIKQMDLAGMSKGCAAAAVKYALDSAAMSAEGALVAQAVVHLAQSVPIETLDNICTVW